MMRNGYTEIQRMGVLGFILVIGLGGLLNAQESTSESQITLVINEYMASNTETLQDPQGDYDDWIELHNYGAEAIDMGGLYLTDDLNEPTKWQLPLDNPTHTTVDPGGYLLIWADGDTDDEGLHTDFKLSIDGEEIGLFASDGITLIDSAGFAEQAADISYGRYPDANDSWQFMASPTPMMTNNDGYFGSVEKVDFSHTRGFYHSPVTVSLTCPTEGAVIYYTLDGVDPYVTKGRMTAGTAYSGPIVIAETSCLRARAVKPGWKSSDISTCTYVFVADVIHQSASGQRPTSAWPSPSASTTQTGPGQQRPGGPGGGVQGSQAMDYGMDTDVVNDPRYANLMEDALLSIPSISLVTDLDNLFNTSTGIYMNAQQDGRTWERPVSVELLHPDDTEGFQIDAGLRIRGGMSRNSRNPKHSFRLFFRSEYGEAKLHYRLFGDEGADTFDKLDLRTGQNFSWHLGSAESSSWLYDIFARDTHRDMGQPYTRGWFCHVYINGQYWGLYQTEERPEANFGASYFGGDKEDYDAVKSSDNQGMIEATDGNLEAYRQLWIEINSGIHDLTDYNRLQGKNSDGTENPDYPRLLDVDNLIDYMILVFYGGNRDAPLGGPGRDEMPRNLFAIYNRTNPDGFKFISHDAEHLLGVHLSAGVNFNRVNVTLKSQLTQQQNCNPWWMHIRLMADCPTYYQHFIDRVHTHFFNNGTLTAEVSTARLQARAQEMDLAIIAESARWGDYLTPNDPRTRDDDWLVIVNRIVDDYLLASPKTRTEVVLEQLRTKGWYPDIDAPTFNQSGGQVASGFTLAMAAPTGTIYYSLDGTDPQTGIEYSGPVTLTKSCVVKARALNNREWSALNEAAFSVGPISDNLRVTEMMYHCLDDEDSSDPNLDFIELKNIGPETINLNLVQFTNGIEFTFPDWDIDANEFILVVEDLSTFTQYYPELTAVVAGQYNGKLDNAGETIRLQDALGDTIQDFEYSDNWYPLTDGAGYSLTIVDPMAENPNSWSQKSGWRPSSYVAGTPGYGD
ncbi:chitobiase/beta-hexosaminidase C-terminal domain-containing protein [Planctomycetota bacterium]